MSSDPGKKSADPRKATDGKLKRKADAKMNSLVAGRGGGGEKVM